MNRTMLWSAGIVAALVAGGVVVWAIYFRTYHFMAVQDGVLYRDGNRSISQLANALRKCSARTVITLVDDGELNDPQKPQFKEEIDALDKQGIKVERIPIPLGGWPTTSDVVVFLNMANDKSRQPVLVHCAQGVRRTGMLVAAYQMSVLGYDKERAKAEMQTFGHSQRTIMDVQRFIDGYDPKARTATTYPSTGLE